MKIRRICPQSGRLPNAASVASVYTSRSDDISSMVRRLIRKELQHTKQYSRDPGLRCSLTATPLYYQCSLQYAPLNQSTSDENTTRLQGPLNNIGEDKISVTAFTFGSPMGGYNRAPSTSSVRSTPTPKYHAPPDVYRKPPACYNRSASRPPGSILPPATVAASSDC